jgi:hypothetical protein
MRSRVPHGHPHQSAPRSLPTSDLQTKTDYSLPCACNTDLRRKRHGNSVSDILSEFANILMFYSEHGVNPYSCMPRQKQVHGRSLGKSATQRQLGLVAKQKRVPPRQHEPCELTCGRLQDGLPWNCQRALVWKQPASLR